MYIASFQIENYKSFLTTPEVGVDLSSSLNVIVGPNNAGKTALLEALSLRFNNNPHRSLKTLRTRDTILNSSPSIHLSFVISKEELCTLTLDRLSTFYLPIPDTITDPNVYSSRSELLDRAFDEMVGAWYRIDCEFWPTEQKLRTAHVPGSLLTEPGNRAGANVRTLFFSNDRARRQLVAHPGWSWTNMESTLGYQVADILKERIYLFHAERLNIGRSAFGANSELAPNAANLPQVLNVLQSTNPTGTGASMS